MWPVFVQITLSDSNPALLDQPINELSCIIKTFRMYINSSTLHNACVLWQPDMHRHISGAAAPPCIHIPCKGEISPNPVSSDWRLFFFPTLDQSCKLLLCDARWRCAMPNELLVTSLTLRSWKLLEELQRHLHVPGLKSASRVPTHFTGFLPVCQPASWLHGPSSPSPAAVISQITKHG